MTELARVAAINPRFSSALDDNDEVSFLGMSDVSEEGTTNRGHLRKYSSVRKGYTPFQDGDLLVAKITPCFENGKIAQANLEYPFGFGSTEFHVVRPDETRVDPRYLLHFLRSPRVRASGEKRMTGSAGQRRVPVDYLRALDIPLPPLPEQRRIAAVLDQADALRAQRRHTLTLLDELADSIFIDTFGGQRGIEKTTVADLLLSEKGSIRTGPFGSDLLHSEFVEAGVPVLGIDNVVQNEFAWAKPRYIGRDKYEQLRRYTVRPGDVLITIMGTVGRCAVVPDDIGIAINTKHLCCITVDQTKCLPIYLQQFFLKHPLARKYLRSVSKGAIMDGLNMGLIRDMPVVLPPIPAQKRFAKSMHRIEDTRAVRREVLAKAEDLFVSLQNRAFQNEL
jgi:type I restriction enzyme S subunit